MAKSIIVEAKVEKNERFDLKDSVGGFIQTRRDCKHSLELRLQI